MMSKSNTLPPQNSQNTKSTSDRPLRTNGWVPEITVKYPQHPPLPDKSGKVEKKP